MADVMDTPPKSHPQPDLATPPAQPAEPSPSHQSVVPPLEPLSPPPPPPSATIRAEEVTAAPKPASHPLSSVDRTVPPTEENSLTCTPIANSDAQPQSESVQESKVVTNAKTSPEATLKSEVEPTPHPSSAVEVETAVEDRTPSKSEPSPVKSEPPSHPVPSAQKHEDRTLDENRGMVPEQPESKPPAMDNQQQQRQSPQHPVQRSPPSWQTAPHVRAGQTGHHGPSSPGPSQPSLITGPVPQNLPKTAKNRPKNSRVFVGNLASEFTNVLEMIRIFYKYGDLIEEPVLRRSFGFIQYSSPDAASRAVASEQGRIIGGIPIDLSIADNREVKRGTHVVNNTPFPHGPKPKLPVAGARGPRPRDPAAMTPGPIAPARKRRRSLSPGAPARRIGVVNPPTFHRMRPEPRTGFHLRILCMSPTARVYAKQCESMFRNEVGLGVEIVQIIASGLGEALAKAMRESIPYVMVVASKDVEDGTCTIRTLERTGYEKAGRGNGIISLREAIDVCLIDRGMPLRHGQPPHPLVPPHQFPSSQHVPLAQAGWTQAGSMNPAARQMPIARKPGWMTSARTPTHSQQQHLRQGLPPQSGIPPHIVGAPPQHQAYPAPHQQQLPPHQVGHMPGRPDGRGQYDRPAPYGAMPPQSAPDYGAPPGQVGWNPGSQQTPMQGYGQPLPQHDYGRGAYVGPHQGALGPRSGAAPNSRDEYDPTAVIPGGNRPQDGGYSSWNGAQQDPGYNRNGPQYPVGRPGHGMRGREQGVPPPVYGMGPPQDAYNPNMSSAQYGNITGNDQGYPQRPGAYGAPPASGPPGGRFTGGGVGPGAGGFDGRGSWGPSNGMPYDARMHPHQQAPGGMPADGRNNHLGYGNGGALMPRRDGPGYMDQRNTHGAQGGDWGGRQANGSQSDSGSRPGNSVGSGGPGGGNSSHGYNGGPGGQNGRAGMNGTGNNGGGGSASAPDGVDIGKLTNLISAFQQQRNMQQGSTPASMGGGGMRSGGPAVNSSASGRGNGNASSSSLLTVQGVPSRQPSGGHSQHAQHGQQYVGQYGAPPPQQHGMYQQPPPSQQQRNYYGR